MCLVAGKGRLRWFDALAGPQQGRDAQLRHAARRG